jgi:hypothetical protein
MKGGQALGKLWTPYVVRGYTRRKVVLSLEEEGECMVLKILIKNETA